MISDRSIFGIIFSISIVLIIVQIVFDRIFRKKDMTSSEMDYIEHQHGIWWYLINPGLGYQEKYKWLAVAPTYLGIGLFIILYAFSFFNEK